MKKLFSSNHTFILSFLAFCGFLFCSNFSYAQTVTADIPLSFGRFVLVDFNTIGEITINTDGTFSKNSNVYTIDEPTRGEYSITDADANALFTITVPSSVTLGGGTAGSFTLDNITVRPTTLMTDGGGNASFTLTGRLRSSGGGTFYSDDVYSDSFMITLNF